MWGTYIIAIIVVSCVSHWLQLCGSVSSKFTMSSIIIYVGMTACFHISHPEWVNPRLIMGNCIKSEV